jgi:hypothetical protein
MRLDNILHNRRGDSIGNDTLGIEKSFKNDETLSNAGNEFSNNGRGKEIF